nr:extracellular solute-binding protein [uncultured Niameybacter sp.]
MAIVVVALIAVSEMQNPIFANQGTSGGSSVVELSVENNSFLENRYSKVIESYKESTYNGKPIVYNTASVVENLNYTTKEVQGYDLLEVLNLQAEDQVTLNIDVPKEGTYCVAFDYNAYSDNILPVELSMQVNDEYPYYELRRLLFENTWVMLEEASLDRYGNEIISIPEKMSGWQTKQIVDASFRWSEPLLIPFKKGMNTIKLQVEEGAILIGEMTLSAPKKDYKPYMEADSVEGNNLIVIEAEQMTYRNDSSIRAGSEFDVDLSPYNTYTRVLNMLDGAAFKVPGQRIDYAFEVEEAGYYKIGLNYRQNSKIDFPVFMDVMIDGEVPYSDLKAYPFAYNKKFEKTTLKNKTNSEEMGFYLEKGSHMISFVLNIDNVHHVIEELERIMKEITNLSLEVTKITGGKVDKNRDFQLEKYIPNVGEQLTSWADQIDNLYQSIGIYNQDVKEIGSFSSLSVAQKQLRALAKKPNELPTRLTELSQGTSSVSQLLANMLQGLNTSPISIDQIYIYQNEKDLLKNENIFVKVTEGIKRFINSFTKQDYSVDNINPEHLQVWVARPRQYVEILQKMADETFTPETGIVVDFSLMPDPNKLVLANAAGETPDIAQSLQYVLPFDLAIRGALADLRQFEDSKEVLGRVPEGLLIPAMIDDSIYAMPETLNFWTLFYRTDILNALDLEVPDTMEDVKKMLPELQRRGMNFFHQVAATVGFKPFFGTMPSIYQQGGSFYGDQVGKTTLDTEESLHGIRELSELFTIYNLPYEVGSFYQKFRDGTLPIGIADYSTYNLLVNAAPEIANSWNIGPYPGVVNEEGEVVRWSAGGAESCVIFEDSDKKDAAWQYLKWWTDKETQVEFGYTLQATYGKEYLWNTANVEAFKELPWEAKHKKAILEQTNWLVESPRVPGTYMLERELSNALNAICQEGKSLRQAIDLTVKRTNRETNRKLEEFGYLKDGEMVKPYPLPTLKDKED